MPNNAKACIYFPYYKHWLLTVFFQAVIYHRAQEKTGGKWNSYFKSIFSFWCLIWDKLNWILMLDPCWLCKNLGAALLSRGLWVEGGSGPSLKPTAKQWAEQIYCCPSSGSPTLLISHPPNLENWGSKMSLFYQKNPKPHDFTVIVTSFTNKR